mmetsp:Transcript_21693/g.42619  ORF Transcript_21693/g.42619 Transcript_21693/m.42619 type:complete len:242 (-) Transcript_21693:420-1145(-)
MGESLEGILGLRSATHLDEPTRGLREHSHSKKDDESTRNALKCNTKTPAPNDLFHTLVEDSHDKDTDGDSELEECDGLTTPLSRSKLGSVHGSHGENETVANTTNSATNDNALPGKALLHETGKGLPEGSKKEDSCSNDNHRLTAETVGNVACKGSTNEGCNVENVGELGNLVGGLLGILLTGFKNRDSHFLAEVLVGHGGRGTDIETEDKTTKDSGEENQHGESIELALRKVLNRGFTII